MTNSIVPSAELLRQWEDLWFNEQENVDVLLIQAFQTGADQELEACCKIALTDPVCGTKHQRSMLVSHIREQRRPKKRSIKQEALLAIDVAVADNQLSPMVAYAVRRALNQIKD